jgi:OPA family glycerol-3-phosphate transporter-like MFS transporter/OPA family sugar phosphate sensor protein UhpC-like MFS transporter
MSLSVFRIFEPAPEIPRIRDTDETERLYRRWRLRILYSSLVGYALFYFVRKNLSVAMPEMERSLGITKTDLGLFLTLHGVLYGVSKFANGFLGDRTNPRYFMAAGLVASAIGMTGFFGYLSTVASGWGLGRLVQSFGWEYGFFAMLAAAVMFVFAWNAYRPDFGTDRRVAN